MKDIFLSTAIILLLITILVLQLLFGGGGESAPAIFPEQIRQFAATLKNQDLHEQAIQEYERYLAVAQIPDELRANILFTIGTTYLDDLADYEDALATFLKISTFYPKATVAREAEKRMIKCYDAMKRGFDAQKKLQKLTDLEPDEEEQGSGPVVAKIGNREIRMDQIEREIAQMPEYARQQFTTPEKKFEYLRSKVFQELLYDAALRKEYDQDKDVRKSVREFEKNLLASKIYNEQVRSKVQVTENDIDLYYKAHPEEFSDPESLQIAHIQVDSLEKAQEVKAVLDAGKSFEDAVKEFSTDENTKAKGGDLGTLRKGMNFITGIGQAPKIAEALFALDEGAVSAPLESAKGAHIFKIKKRIPETIKPLDQVRKTVEAKMAQIREKEQQEQLLEQMLKAENVKLYERAFQSAQPRVNPSDPNEGNKE